MMKLKSKCLRCRKFKVLSEFYKDAARTVGVQGYCKLCDHEYRREWDRANPEKRNKHRAVQRQRRLIAHRANKRISNAVSRGKIHKPRHCEICGKQDKLDGHHTDYDRWAAVQWLCRTCHATTHRRILEATT